MHFFFLKRSIDEISIFLIVFSFSTEENKQIYLTVQNRFGEIGPHDLFLCVSVSKQYWSFCLKLFALTFILKIEKFWSRAEQKSFRYWVTFLLAFTNLACLKKYWAFAEFLLFLHMVIRIKTTASQNVLFSPPYFQFATQSTIK